MSAYGKSEADKGGLGGDASVRTEGEVMPKGVSQTVPYAIYNIGNSSPVSLMEFVSAIEHHLGKTAIKEFLPMQPGDVPHTEADVADLVKNLGYKPNTPVSDGIGEFIKWYKQYFKR